jgi:hypothetical protein
MLGSFLEISLWSRDIAASVAFWERLGFGHGLVGDTWRHRYAVLSDGRAVLGLHDYEFDSPSLTWVRPELAGALPAFAALGIRLDFAKTGQDEFNEAGFHDPAGHVVTLLEARTWSPAYEFRRPGPLGHFREYRYPARDPVATVEFWERLGLIADPAEDGPRAIARGINLAPRAEPAGPELVYEHAYPAAAAAALAAAGYSCLPAPGGAFLLPAPDGLTLRIQR